MASLALLCPMCCNETFVSHEALKEHLLKLNENIACLVCEIKFKDIRALAEHVGRQCRDNDSDNDNENSKFEVEPNSEECENKTQASDAADNNEKTTRIKQKNDDQKYTYTCQMCDMNFNSVEKHLEKYHQGEEVFLETDENEILGEDANTTQQDSDHDNDEESECIYIYNENENTNDENIAIPKLEPKPDPLDNAEYICMDQRGQRYSRKIVKVGKFWEKQEKPPPITDKYIVENGNIKQITDEEASTTAKSIVEIHKCPVCNLQFPEKKHYEKHVCMPEKVKPGRKPKVAASGSKKLVLSCNYCHKTFEDAAELSKHITDHVTIGAGNRKVVSLGPHMCTVCNTTFPSYKSLRLHERMHEPPKNKKIIATNQGETFVCDICDTTYDKAHEEIHMQSHSDVNDYNCTVCNKKFYTKTNLEMHMNAHSNERKHVCSYCKKTFTTEDMLVNHVKNQCKERQYECQYCGRKFSRPHEKVKHERIHTGEKPHVCELCGKAFRVSYCLTLHLRTHTNTRPYSCNICNKKFKSHGVYNHHLQTHSEERNYKCSFCPKAFKTSVQLAGHKNSHTKPFVCTECNRPFASLYAVRSHMETHKKDNNLKHECWLCGATYARQFALRDHMKSQHSTEVVVDSEEQVVELDDAKSTTTEIVDEEHYEQYHIVREEDEEVTEEHEAENKFEVQEALTEEETPMEEEATAEDPLESPMKIESVETVNEETMDQTEA